jgi:hypothetical protein
MNILLIDIDSKIPNLALYKIAKYHTDKGDHVEWDMPLYRPLADKVYISCVFEKNRGKCYDYEDDTKCLIGGSGYDLKTVLPEEIENIKPRINLGFTTRGCIRHCPFCIVPEKEGRIRAVGDLLDLWDGKSKDIVLLDNNILALPKHFKMICKQARENNIRLDFNQGLDCRLLNQDIVNELKSIRHQELHFAWDDLSYEKSVIKAIDLLQENNINRCTWLMLVGFNTTLKEDLYRAEYLKSRNQNAYVMRYNGKTTPELTRLSRWVNNRAWFQAITWEQFLKRNYPNELISEGVE